MCFIFISSYCNKEFIWTPMTRKKKCEWIFKDLQIIKIKINSNDESLYVKMARFISELNRDI